MSNGDDVGSGCTVIVEPVYEKRWPDGFCRIGWRARIGERTIHQAGYKSQVLEWLERNHPDFSVDVLDD